MNFSKYLILSSLTLFSYISQSYGFSNSKDWCLPQNKYQRNIPFHKLEDGDKCPSNTYSITDKRALKILLIDYGGYINKIIETGDICYDTYKNYKYLRELIKDEKNLDCKKILQKLADKKTKESLNIALAQEKAEEAKQNAIAEKKAEEARIRALAEKLAKEEIARQLKVKQKEEEAKQKAIAAQKAKEDAARKKALAKKKAEKLAKQKALAAKKAKEDAARKKALAKGKAEELAKQKAIATKKAEEEELKQRVLNEKIQKIKDEAKFIVATLKEYVTTDTNKLDILEVSELLENYNNEMQKGWSDTTVEKYEELYDYVQKDEGFIEFSADKKSKQLAAYNEEIRQLREYLTTSQLELKAFITKNLGSKNASKALKLAKETKKILKDFEVSQAMTLKNNIATWKAMNGVKEDKKYTFKLINKKFSIKTKSTTKQVVQNKSKTEINTNKKNILTNSFISKENITVKFFKEQNTAGSCKIPAEAINGTPHNFKYFYMSAHAYDNDSNKISEATSSITSLRPNKNKNFRDFLFLDIACKEINSIKITWHDNLTLIDGTRLYRDQNAVKKLERLNNVVKLKWFPSFALITKFNKEIVNLKYESVISSVESSNNKQKKLDTFSLINGHNYSYYGREACKKRGKDHCLTKIQMKNICKSIDNISNLAYRSAIMWDKDPFGRSNSNFTSYVQRNIRPQSLKIYLKSGEYPCWVSFQYSGTYNGRSFTNYINQKVINIIKIKNKILVHVTSKF